MPIIQKENKILRQKAESVSVAEIKTASIQNVLADMQVALEGEDDGVAIAAPQIGVSLRIFVVSKKVKALIKGLEGEELKKELAKSKDQIYINPQIKKLSKDKKSLDEGCLSVRYLYGKIERSEKATITAYDEKGKKFTKGASGLLAQIFQHEIDHLDGVLFIDKAQDIVEVLPKTPPTNPEPANEK